MQSGGWLGEVCVCVCVCVRGVEGLRTGESEAVSLAVRELGYVQTPTAPTETQVAPLGHVD